MERKFLTLAMITLFFIPDAFAQKDLAGTWKAEFKGDGMSMPITWHLDNDGTYTLDMYSDGNIDIHGRYEIENDTLYLWDLNGNAACEKDKKGTYTIKFDSDTMDLTLIEDDCGGRNRITPSVIWTKLDE